MGRRYFHCPAHADGAVRTVVDLDYMTRGFFQFQADASGKLNLASLTLADGQHFEFRRQ